MTMDYQELLTAPRQIVRGHTVRETANLPREAAAVLGFLGERGIAAGTAVLWQANAILWGKWADGKLTLADDAPLAPALWLELRLFGEDYELFLRGAGERLQGRFLREAAEGAPTSYLDTMSRLWGQRAGEDGEWLSLVDAERKLRLTLPRPAATATYYGLVTRNYIEANAKSAQAGYADYRYVAIASADMGQEEGGGRDG